MRLKKFKLDKIYHVRNEKEVKDLLKKHPRMVFTQWDEKRNGFKSERQGTFFTQSEKYFYVDISGGRLIPYTEPLSAYASWHCWKYNEYLTEKTFG